MSTTQNNNKESVICKVSNVGKVVCKWGVVMITQKNTQTQTNQMWSEREREREIENEEPAK